MDTAVPGPPGMDNSTQPKASSFRIALSATACRVRIIAKSRPHGGHNTKGKTMADDRIWQYGVEYGRRSGSYGSADSLSGALSRAYVDATYYLSVGYARVTIVGPREECKPCWSTGRVLSRGKMVRCKSCRGKGVFQTLPNFCVQLDESVRITNTATDPIGGAA